VYQKNQFLAREKYLFFLTGFTKEIHRFIHKNEPEEVLDSTAGGQFSGNR
jgi:hypothetical protein